MRLEVRHNTEVELRIHNLCVFVRSYGEYVCFSMLLSVCTWSIARKNSKFTLANGNQSLSNTTTKQQHRSRECTYLKWQLNSITILAQSIQKFFFFFFKHFYLSVAHWLLSAKYIGSGSIMRCLQCAKSSNNNGARKKRTPHSMHS